MVADRCYRGFIKRLSAAEPGEELRARILRDLATEQQPELSAIHLMRGAADFGVRVAPYVTAFLTQAWRR